MKIHVVLIVTIVLIMDKASCGVIDGMYDKVSDTTHAIKDDVYSWWTYGVDTIMGDNVKVEGPVTNQTFTEEKEQPGIFGRLYKKVKGGVTSGYMKIHDMVLGKDSDPNKGIIKTLYERAMKKLTDVQSYVFEEDHPENKSESQAQDEAIDQQVIKLLFDSKTDIFNTDSEKQALDSLRQKLTQTGDEIMHLADNEKELVRKAYTTIRSKSDELFANASEFADSVKNKLSENIEKTQEVLESQAQDEAIDQQVIKLLFDSKTDIFNTDSEKQALDSLRQKLTQTGDKIMHLADNEKELVRKAYTTIRSKPDELFANASESADSVKNKLSENIEKTQEFIHDASQKTKEGAENIGKEVKEVADNIEKKVQSE